MAGTRAPVVPAHAVNCGHPKDAAEVGACASIQQARAADAAVLWTARGAWLSGASQVLLLMTVVFTVLATRAAQRSARAAEKGLAQGQEGTRTQLRAYVALDTIQPLIQPNGRLDVTVVWRNTGLTPAYASQTQINTAFVDQLLPADFSFPDSNPGPPQPGMLPAGQASMTRGPTVSSYDQSRIAAGEMHYYVYGWMRYRDVFPDTPDRLTQFCSKLGVEAFHDGNKFHHWLTEPRFNRHT